MGLSADLISQFVKITKEESKTNQDTVTYGTVVVDGDVTYVKIDGSELNTPVATTTGVQNGDRVTVMIKNHSAVITGNLTAPSTDKSYVDGAVDDAITEFNTVIAHKVSANELEAFYATINSLSANLAQLGKLEAVSADINSLKAKIAEFKYVTADEVDVLNAYIENLRSIFGEFKDLSAENLAALTADIDVLRGYTASFTYVSADRLHAMRAHIEELETKKLSAEEASIKYANIDFSNIGKAAMEELYAKSGLIKDVVIENGTITGNLVGVTIKGDLIEGGTVKADKLVIKGNDGLFYKLNVEGGKLGEAEQVPEDSLHGSIITAHSITAEKVSVTDLVAFGATIGGFTISDDAIYSGVKTSADNTTTGIYLDNEGQMAVGDETNFIRYFRNEDGKYVLEISTANDIRQDITEQVASAVQTCEGFILSALESYVTTTDHGDFRELISSEIAALADRLTVSFTDATERINDVDQDLQDKFNTITKYFTFDINGLTIGEVDCPYKIVLDNDRYSMFVNGAEVLWIDIRSREVHTPEITVTDRLRMLGYKVEKDSNGNLDWDYIGDVISNTGDVIDNTPTVTQDGTLVFPVTPTISSSGVLIFDKAPEITESGVLVF